MSLVFAPFQNKTGVINQLSNQMKKKLQIEDLKVNSFVTKSDKEEVKGGSLTSALTLYPLGSYCCPDS